MAQAIEGFRLGEAMPYRNLCIFPVFAGADVPPSYMSLKQALEKKLVEITEVSESGSVPNLKVTNNADEPVLLVDGEELAGAKQNRIVNTSLLLAAKSETVIPVSCTEQGRWRYSSPSFMESGVMMSSSLRYKKSARVMASLKMNQRYDAMQSEVWKDVEGLHRSSGTASQTGAMRDVYMQKEGDVGDYMTAFPLQEGQKGQVVFLNGKLLGIDFISRQAVYQDLHEKLLKSHIVEALYQEEKEFDPVNLEIEANLFLKSLAGPASIDEFKPVGLGVDLRFESNAAAGAALVYEERVVHLTAFKKANSEQPDSGAESRGASSRWSLTERFFRHRSTPPTE